MNPSDQPAPNDPIPNIPSDPIPNVPPAPEPPPVPPGAAPPPPPYEVPPVSGYGASVPPLGAPGSTPFGTPTSEEKNWALAAHMSALIMLLSVPGVVGPLVIWLIKKDTMPYVNEHGKEALNFQLTQLMVMLACVVIGFLTCSVGFVVTGPLIILDAIFAIVMAIIAGLKAGNGEFYRYPLCWRLIK